MKKQEKIDLIEKSIAEKEICRCFFSYDPGYFYCYPNAVNDRFILGQEEDDFLLDGYFIRKISHLKKVEIRMDHCNAINQMIGVTDQVMHPGVDITDWRSIFESLSSIDTFVIIEDNTCEQFAIGVIQKVLKDKIYFKGFNAKGVWDENELEIRYSQITGVEPAVFYNIVSFLFTFVVALHDVIALDTYLAFFGNLDFNVREKFTCIAYFTSSWTSKRNHRSGLSHAVTFEDIET